MYEFDVTPIDTDWEDIHELFADIRRFAKAHPHHTFICADDPGANYQPPRVPRMGWCAYPSNPCPLCSGRGQIAVAAEPDGEPYRSSASTEKPCDGCKRTGKVASFQDRAKVWTITLSAMKNSFRRSDTVARRMVQTAAGRAEMLRTLVASARGETK